MDFSALVYGGIIIAALLVIGFTLTRLYRRAPKDAALIRTGFGGEKVIMNGGVIVLPVLHELMQVSLTTIKLNVERVQKDALITLDKIRVDVVGLFHIRVAPNTDAVSAAAQTLGPRINDQDAVRSLLDGKLVSALRSVAAKMTMQDLHANRDQFTEQVRNNLKDELAKNGFELETVSLTHFGQTNIEFLNPDDAFDAEGLTAIKLITEDRKKVRNDIEADNRVAIEQKNFEANKRSLEIEKSDQFNTLAQKQEVAERTAEQEAAVKAAQAQRAQEAEQARIDAENATKLREVEALRLVDQANLERERQVEITRQETSIATAVKSKEESVARKAADEARAQAVTASEGVITAKATAEAERQKRIAVIDAQKDAEQKAVSITVQATAERDAAKDRAEAARVSATGEAEAQRIRAKGESDAILLAADAAERKYQVDAEGQRSLNEAANALSSEQVRFNERIAIVGALPEVIRESVKPAENIDSIRIVHVSGLGNGGSDGSSEGAASGGNLADQAVNAALRYRTQAPIIDSLLNDIGFNNGLESLVTAASPISVSETSPPVSTSSKPTAPKADDVVPVVAPTSRRRRPEVHGAE